MTTTHVPAMIQAHMAKATARREEWVFLTTVMGMTQRAAALRLDVPEDAVDRTIARWLAYLDEHPQDAAWHAAAPEPGDGHQWLRGRRPISGIRHARDRWRELVDAGADPVAAALEAGAGPEGAVQAAEQWHRYFSGHQQYAAAR